MRWRKPSERCASATKPSGAFSFLQEITAAPTLINRPLHFTHLFVSEFKWGVRLQISVASLFGISLQTLQLIRQIHLSDLRGAFNPHNMLLSRFFLGFGMVSSDSTSRYDISASYDLKKTCSSRNDI